MRLSPRPLSAACAALAATLVGLVLVTPASAGNTTAERYASSVRLSASSVAERRAALEAAGPARAGFRSYAGAASLRACYGTERTSPADGTPLDAGTYGAYHGCISEGAWLFRVGTRADFARSDVRAISFTADTDGNPSTGCGGYEWDVFGFWSAEQQAFLAGVFSTPDCDTDDLTAVADLQMPTAREIGLQFRHADLRGGSTVRWYGALRAVADTATEFLPEDGAHVETGFGGGAAPGPTPSPAPTGADGCPTSGNSWYAATSDPDAVRELREAGLDRVRRVRGGLVAFEGDRRDAQEALDGVAVHRDVERRLHAVPNDPGLSSQWALSAVRAAEAWDVTKGSRDVVVAVLDSGIDATHPDLQGQLLPGWDATTSSPLPSGNSDPNGHGTASAGVVAAATDNAAGLASLGWGTRVLPVKVEDASGSIRLSYLVNGIRYAADAGAAVINMSLGSCTASETELSAVRYAQSKGVLVVASAGNEALQGNPVEYPAAYPDVLAVGATGRDGTRAVYSNTGSYVDLVAPGGTGTQGPDNDVVMLKAGGGTFTSAGTSFSSPLVAAAAALAKAVNPRLSGVALGDLLTRTARDLGTPGRDAEHGAGVLDAAAAVQGASTVPDAVTPAVSVSTRTPAPGQSVAVDVRTTPGATVDLWAYSAPSTTYRRVRTGTTPGTGTVRFSLAPSTNTRLYATATSASGRPVSSASVPLTVAARVSTAAPVRRAALTYRFTGAIQPGRAGVPVTLYSRAADGALTRLAATRTGSGGRWSLDRRFAKAATVTVVARTTADAVNASGTSAPRRVAVR